MNDCRHTQRAIWTGDAIEEVTAHAQGCADCRAELLRASDMIQTLSLMRDVTLPAPAGLHEAILSGLEDTWSRRARDVVSSHPRLWRGVGVGAAAAAATALGLVIARRRQRPQLAA